MTERYLNAVTSDEILNILFASLFYVVILKPIFYEKICSKKSGLLELCVDLAF